MRFSSAQRPLKADHAYSAMIARVVWTATASSGFIAQFERDLHSERVKSGLAAARARGKKLGRQPGQRPVADKLADKVTAAVAEGQSYRWIARDLAISKNTVLEIMKRHHQSAL